MLRFSSIKCLTIYSTQIKNYSKLVTDQIIFVLFVRLNQERYTISFSNALTQSEFGTMLNFFQGSSFFAMPLTNLLNYVIIVGKLLLWDCRRNQILPKIKTKCEIERKISKKDYLKSKASLRLRLLCTMKYMHQYKQKEMKIFWPCCKNKFLSSVSNLSLLKSRFNHCPNSAIQ